MHGFILPHTPLGPLWAEVQGGALTRASWRTPTPTFAPLGAVHPAQAWLEAYFNGARTAPSAAWLAPQGTPFQQKVWQALLAIPYGQTRTYGQLAAQLGTSPRAVGGAVGRNPLPLFIPCHRVMGTNGALTGFSAPGGLASKSLLLHLESCHG